MKTPTEVYALLAEADPVSDPEGLDANALVARVEAQLGQDAATAPHWQSAEQPTRDLPEPRRRSWRGLVVAIGSAAVVLAAVGGVALLTGLFEDTKEIAESQSEPPSPAEVGLFSSHELKPSGDPLWTARGAHHGVVYVDSIDKVLVFGGLALEGPPGSESDPGNWVPTDQTVLIDLDTLTVQQIDTAAAPPPRAFHAVEYDRQSDRVIVFGGIPPQTGDDDWDYGDTWAFDPVALSWEEMQPASSPPPSAFNDMVYDFFTDRIVLVGSVGVWSYDYETDTWREDSDAWGNATRDIRGDGYGGWHGFMQGSAAIDPMSGVILASHRVPSLTYDPDSARFIGHSGSFVLAYDLATDAWIRLRRAPAIGGDIEGEVPMIYDPVRRQVVLFSAALTLQGPDVPGWRIWTMPGSALTDEHTITVMVDGLEGMEGWQVGGVVSRGFASSDEDGLGLIGYAPIGGFAATVDAESASVSETVRLPLVDTLADEPFPFVSSELLAVQPGAHTVWLWVGPEIGIYTRWMPACNGEALYLQSAPFEVRADRASTHVSVRFDLSEAAEICPP